MMPDYILQDCNVTVPDAFRDHTMNLFTLSNSGANEFTFVISRAVAGADETLQSVTERLAKELDTLLEKLTVLNSRLINLADRQTDRQTGRQADRQTDRQTGRQAGRRWSCSTALVPEER